MHACRREVERELKELGGTLVATPEEAAAALADSGLPIPRLGLDCVSGECGSVCVGSGHAGGCRA